MLIENERKLAPFLHMCMHLWNIDIYILILMDKLGSSDCYLLCLLPTAYGHAHAYPGAEKDRQSFLLQITVPAPAGLIRGRHSQIQ